MSDLQETVSEELSDSQKTWKMKSPCEDLVAMDESQDRLEDEIEALIDLEGGSGMLAVAPEVPDTPRKTIGQGRCEGSAEKLEQKKQFPLERFFSWKPGCKTAMEESDMRMRAIRRDGTILKTKGRGRPSEVSKALQAARNNGETLIVASMAEYNLAVQKEVEYKLAMGMKHGLGGSSGGNICVAQNLGMKAMALSGSGVVIGLTSNRKLALVQFAQGRQKLVIGCSDQIPVWVKIGRRKAVYCEREVKSRKTSADFRRIQRDNLKKEEKKQKKTDKDRQRLEGKSTEKEKEDGALEAIAEESEVDTDDGMPALTEDDRDEDEKKEMNDVIQDDESEDGDPAPIRLQDLDLEAEDPEEEVKGLQQTETPCEGPPEVEWECDLTLFWGGEEVNYSEVICKV